MGCSDNNFFHRFVGKRKGGSITVSWEMDVVFVTLRPDDWSARTARSRMRNYMPPAMVRRSY